MRVAVYSIALNESRFAERWAKSSIDADYRLVADTGSIDDTIDVLKTYNVNVATISVKPFRFDDARNAALALLPDDVDVTITLDMDEVLTPGWRERLEQSWHGTRLHYGYVWSWTAAGMPDLSFHGNKIVGRHSHRWKHPVHEVLVPTVPEVICSCEHVLIEHHPDPHKSRSYYLDMLKLAVTEDPSDDRNAHYLGREYFFNARYREAIDEFSRHLALPKAVWLPERASSMRYIGKCYHALGDRKQAHRWFIQATLEDDTSREALIDAATFLLSQNAFHATIDLCDRALKVLPSENYMAERYANQEGAFDLAAIAYFYLGDRVTAIRLATEALRYRPDDSRLQANLKMMMDDDQSRC